MTVSNQIKKALSILYLSLFFLSFSSYTLFANENSSEKLTPQETRMKLKAMGRLHFDAVVIHQYKKTLEKYPKNFEIRADYIDLLLENEKLDEAEDQIQLLEKNHPENKFDAPVFRARLALKKNNPQRALDIYQKVDREFPNELGVTIGLAESHAALHHSKESLRYYDDALKMTDNPLLKKMRNDVFKNTANTVQTNFHFVHVGSDEFFEESVQTKNNFLDHYFIETENTLGQFDDEALGRTDTAFYGTVLGGYRFNPELSVYAGPSYGFSDARNAIGFTVGGLYEKINQWKISVEGKIRSFDPESARHALQGSVSDSLRVEGNYFDLSPFLIQAAYEFTHRQLPGGESSTSHLIEPSFSYILKELKPYISVGYQLTYFDVSNSPAFLALFPLVPKINAHYLTASANHPLTPTITVDAGVFIGEDFERDLHFFEGDLWGMRANVIADLGKFFEANAGYNYSRESRTGITTGHFHEVLLSLKKYY